MSLDVYLNVPSCGHCNREDECVFQSNVTGNLARMATAADIGDALWRPGEIGITKASQLIDPLTKGLAWLKENRSEALKYQPPNGWGTYDDFVPWVAAYLAACVKYPNATVSVWR